MDELQSKVDWYKMVGAVVILVGLIAGGINFAYKEWYKIPNLTYEVLDSYPISSDEYIIPILIRNEGHEKATNVRVTIYTGGIIQSVQKKASEELNLNIENNSLIATLPRLVDNSQITFYFRVKTFSQRPINEILIASDQGSGGIHDSSKSPEGYYYFIVFIAFVLIIDFITSYNRREFQYKTMKALIEEAFKKKGE